jgi:hypothetical protein
MPEDRKPARTTTRVFGILVITLLGLCTAYAAASRGWWQIFKAFTPWIAFVILAFAGAGVNTASSTFWRRVESSFQFIAVVLGFVGCGTVLFFIVGPSLEDLYTWISKLDSAGKRTLVGTVILVAVGTGLFWFRLMWRSTYGATEALVGVLVGIQRLMSAPDNWATDRETFVVLLTASVYLIVRGLDNVHHGLTKEPLDPVFQRLRVLWRKVSGDRVELAEKSEPTKEEPGDDLRAQEAKEEGIGKPNAA